MEQTKIKTAVFPVAGFGTRFLPVTKSQPKEMLPVVDKPVIHYLVEEAVASGIEEIIMITGRGKRAIEDYFDQSFELEHNLVERGKHHLLKEVLEIPNMARFVYVRQALPKGDGDAILQVYDIIKNEPFAVMFGDNLIMSDVPALSQLIDVYEKTGAPVIGLTEVADEDLSSYGIVGGNLDDSEILEIDTFVEKPARKSEAPSNMGVIGKFIVTPRIMEYLHSFTGNNMDCDEIRLADAWKKALHDGYQVLGKVISGESYDTGSKFGLIKATIDYALKREDMNGHLKDFLRSRCSCAMPDDNSG